MRVYRFGFKGLYMGGHIIVLAESEVDAIRIAQYEIDMDEDLGDKQKKGLKLYDSYPIKESIIFYDNGDY